MTSRISSSQEDGDQRFDLTSLEMGEQNVTLKTLEHLANRLRCKIRSCLGNRDKEQQVGAVGGKVGRSGPAEEA